MLICATSHCKGKLSVICVTLRHLIHAKLKLTVDVDSLCFRV